MEPQLTKVAVTIDAMAIIKIDRLVERMVFANHSQAEEGMTGELETMPEYGDVHQGR